MAKRGRPKEHSDDKVAELVAKFRQYIEETDIPIIAEFAYQNDVTRQLLYEREEFSTLLKKCVAKKEVALERGALTGALNPTMAVFSLKQLGWTDKHQVESTNTNHNTNQDITQLSPDERRARIDELNRRRGNGANRTT
jgi:hypothetical protein